MHDAFVALSAVNDLLDQNLYVKSQSIASTSNTTFWWALQRKQNESFLSQSEHIIWVSRHRNVRTQYLHLSVFIWKQYIIQSSYKDFCILQSFWLCTPLPILTQSFFSWNLHTEIVIFINVSYQMKCFDGDNFSFFRSRFC